ncbi:MAG TPA: choice-of-anchor tandem repeat GloVer-containing protein [Candidatus Acidoferrum sp.]|nr:choice-of-anchor tandem repeat GloVer-containing protein [Candidatus Acidoferrum sp.]
MWKLTLSKVTVVCVFCLPAAIPSSAQTFTTLVTFNGANGEDPRGSLVQGTDGNFYGTTFFGGANNVSACAGFGFGGCGTVFKITAGGSLTTLYSFCAQTNCTDGRNPAGGLVQGSDGSFYGIANGGGANNDGTVFKITPQGMLTTLHDFNARIDGAGPLGGLVLASDGNLYGTTQFWGTHGVLGLGGTVFRITQAGTLTTLYSFCAQTNCTDGANPQAALIQAIDGNLYGTTSQGGASTNCTSGCGTVFTITSSGVLVTLHSFSGADGSLLSAGLVQIADGSLYGTTENGGPANWGTVFKITTSGTFSTLHSFCAPMACTDGSGPRTGLVQGTDGNLYGAASFGGASSKCTAGCGTLFKISASGTLTALHSFSGADGQDPLGMVQGTDGSFYGITGAVRGTLGNSDGTVFNLSVSLGPFVMTSPTSGQVGAAVIILGNNLTGTTGVSFNGTAATFTVVSNSEIQTTVPVGATTGIVQVTAPAGVLNSNVPFQVTKPRKRRTQLTSE